MTMWWIRRRNLEIHIELDEEAKTLTVSDTGIGMNRDEIIAGLGHDRQVGGEGISSRRWRTSRMTRPQSSGSSASASTRLLWWRNRWMSYRALSGPE